MIVDFAGTVRHDGRRRSDDLATPDGLATWVRTHAEPLGDLFDLASYAPTVEDRERVVALRTAVRTLFARAVNAPVTAAECAVVPSQGGPATTTDSALADVNAAAALLGAPQLDWPETGSPRRRHPADPTQALLGGLAVAAIDLLAGPDRDRLRACQAPRCVRFFIKQDPRQEWCRPACGNRARVARFHSRRLRAVT